MIFVRHDEDNHNYCITFKYHPDIVNLVKQVPSRKWNPELKLWTIDEDKLGFLVNQFMGTKYESELMVNSEEHIGENATLEETKQTEIPDIDVSKIHMYVKDGGELYPHQIDFMKYSIDRYSRGHKSGFLLADQPGLGKSLEATNFALFGKEHYGFKHCLIICNVNSSKFNWYHDIKDHTNGEYVPYILGTRFKRDGSKKYCGSSEKFDDLNHVTAYGKKDEELPYFLILNIEALRYKVGKQYMIVDQIIRWIRKGWLGMIIVDEVHKNVSMTSMQGKQLLRIKKSSERQVYWLPMTGTPITNKPTDLFLPLRLTDSHNYNSYYNWCQQFCIYGGYGGHEIIGYKNIPHLKEITQGNMLRRLKKDVLNLPPKVEHTEYVENTPYQQNLYEKVLLDIRNNFEEIKTSFNPLSKLLRLRQVNGAPELVDMNLSIHNNYISKNAKLARLIDLLDDIIESGEKVVVFSDWVETLRTLYKFIKTKYKNVCCFTGTMPQQERERHKFVFQTDDNYKILLGTIGAAGTTHTFTAATNVIFYDEPWTPADKEQASDRIYRIGTTESVNIYTMITMDTVDQKVHDILYRKQGVSNYIIDNKFDAKINPDLFKYLIDMC